MSGWVQVDVSLLRNPKLIMFARTNKISEMEAVGALVKLWAYSFEYGKKPGLIPNPELCKDMIWNGLDLLNPMIDARFIDKKKNDYFVHDWEDKYSQLDSYRKMNALRQKEYRQRKRQQESDKKYKEIQKKLHPEIADELQ